MRTPLSLRVLSSLVAVALLGCSSLETRITRPEDQPTSMRLRIEVPQPDGSSSSSVVPGPSANVIVDDGTNTLNITAVQVVLNQVEFRRDSTEGCVDSDDPSEDDGDPCAELAVQPSVLDLPVASNPVETDALVVDPGTYEALEFDLHVANAQDVPQNLSLVGGSVRIQGSYNGSAISDALYAVSGQVELELDDPIELEDGFSSGMTLIVDVADWFRDSGGSVIDPSNAAAKDSAARAEIAERIMNSFSVEAGV